MCKADLDKFDPWRLPAIQTENIALRHPRPDVSVAIDNRHLVTQGAPNGAGDSFFIDGDPPNAGESGDIEY